MINPDKFEGVPNVNNVSGNEGLPQGAKKFEDEEIDGLLKEMRDEEVEFYDKNQMTINGGIDISNKNIPGLEEFEVEISGPESKTFNGELHPRVEGVSWYREISVTDPDNPNNQILIFSGWFQPWVEKPLSSIIYTVGEISAQTVRAVIRNYTEDRSNKIKSFNPNRGNK